MDSRPLLPAASAAPTLYPDFSRRVSGAILDGIIMLIILFAAAILVIFAFEQADAADSRWKVPLIWAVGLCGSWLYSALSESYAGTGTFGTPGPVTDIHGDRIGFWHASARFACMPLSIAPLFLGFIMCVWTPRRQTLHDLLTHTYLVGSSKLWAFKQDNPVR